MKFAEILAGVALIAAAEPSGPRACGDWSRSPREDFTNRTLPNFGCADAANLAAMVATPTDLARGRGTGQQAGAEAARAVERYRTDTATALGNGASNAAPVASMAPQ